jgi:hypothetical protein
MAATPSSAHLQVTYDGSEWKVSLNGHSLERMLAPGGLQITANDYNMAGPVAVLTFVDVELDVDLKDVIVAASKRVP